MYSVQDQLTRFYQVVSELKWQMKKLEKDFSCPQCSSVKKCLDISNSGDVNKFLNQRGEFVTIDPLDCDEPLFTASVAYGITALDVSHWNTAYTWGNHAAAGYLTSYTETDPIYTSSSWYTTTNNSSNWNTAYGWGNHASAGYLTALPSHNHDDRYYTESEVDTLLSGKQNTLGFTPENAASKTTNINGAAGTYPDTPTVKTYADTKLAKIVVSTSHTIDFSTPTQFGTIASPLTTSLLVSYTGAINGMVQIGYHQAAAKPAIPVSWTEVSSDFSYVANQPNFFAVWFIGNSKAQIIWRGQS